MQFTFCSPAKESKEQLLDKALQVTSTFPFHSTLTSQPGLSQSYRQVARHQYTIRMNTLQPPAPVSPNPRTASCLFPNLSNRIFPWRRPNSYQVLDAREWNELIHQKLDFKKFGIGSPTHPLRGWGGRRECRGVRGQGGGSLGLPAATYVGLLEARGKVLNSEKFSCGKSKGQALEIWPRQGQTWKL